MPQFTLKINLGTELMSSPSDLAYALKRVVKLVEYHKEWYDLLHNIGTIRDFNGNKVGEFEVTTE